MLAIAQSTARVWVSLLVHLPRKAWAPSSAAMQSIVQQGPRTLGLASASRRPLLGCPMAPKLAGPRCARRCGLASVHDAIHPYCIGDYHSGKLSELSSFFWFVCLLCLQRASGTTARLAQQAGLQLGPLAARRRAMLARAEQKILLATTAQCSNSGAPSVARASGENFDTLYRRLPCGQMRSCVF